MNQGRNADEIGAIGVRQRLEESVVIRRREVGAKIQFSLMYFDQTAPGEVGEDRSAAGGFDEQAFDEFSLVNRVRPGVPVSGARSPLARLIAPGSAASSRAAVARDQTANRRAGDCALGILP